MQDNPIAELLDLLETERCALLRGDFDTLSGLADRKHARLRHLLSSRPAASDLDMLQRTSLRNQKLLAAAQAGIADARALLAALLVPSVGATYGPAGDKRDLAAHAHQMRRSM